MTSNLQRKMYEIHRCYWGTLLAHVKRKDPVLYGQRIGLAAFKSLYTVICELRTDYTHDLDLLITVIRQFGLWRTAKNITFKTRKNKN